MTRIRDVAPRETTDGAQVPRSGPAAPLLTMSDGELADEHRGQSFAKKRAAERIEQIEAELQRRGITEAKGKLSAVRRHSNDGLIDLAGLRAEHPELVRRYAKPGSEHYFRSRTLTREERA